ncbi:MAG TPA: outer membrane beta-barrel protein [Bryobacteraceae bacterium]|nr:outer membrane beta-barrel protein [Bryobacteraceae bacterium]
MLVIYRQLCRLCLLTSVFTLIALAQENNPVSASAENNPSGLSQQITELRALVQKLQARVDELEKRSQAQSETDPSPSSPPQSTNAAPQQQAQATSSQPASPTSSPGPDFLHGTTFNLLIDGYYGYNFNDPIGRVNLLRAYDISSNAFSLNQAALVVESAADPESGKRFGLRLDLQYGQATETLQGNPANEPRPDIYRNIFQAYGTYVFPIGKGLTVDFGKFASSLGIEGNYTQDQMNYSRSYWFNFLPFYHMGARVNYKFNDKLALNYWIVNGTQQTEPFNGFKDQFVGFAITPNKNITWNVNYYLGQEHVDVIFFPNGGAPPNLPTEQGVPFEPILNPPAGKLHIFDTYVTWQTTPKFTWALEADDEIERLYTYSAPSHTDGGAGYLRYQLTPKVALAGRAEYLSDRGGLFTGVTQALKETTLTTEYKFADGFLARGEWRRDFSNQPYFLTDILGILRKEQNTATLGLVWWVGGKEGSW